MRIYFMMMLKRLLISLSLGAALVWAQCPTLSSLPPAPSCDNCEALQANSGSATIPANQTRCVPANVSMTLNNLNLNNGSTLIICGELKLNSWLNMNNNVNIYIAPSGRLDAHGINDNPNTAVYNYGIVNLSNSLNLNGNTSRFYNIGSGAQLNVGGDINVNSSNGLINYGGQVSANELRINGSGSVCAGYLGCFSLNNFTSNGNNKIEIVGTQPAALTFTGQSTINGNSVTNSSSLLVCRAPNATQNGSGTWGSAQVYNNCSQGCGILPYAALKVRVQQESQNIRIAWVPEGALASRVSHYAVEILEGATFQELGRTPHTQWEVPTFQLSGRGEYAFQVKGYAADGQLLAVGQARLMSSDRALMVFPTIFSHELRFISPTTEQYVLLNVNGQLIGRLTAYQGEGRWNELEDGTPLAGLTPGIYILRGEAGSAVRLVKVSTP